MLHYIQYNAAAQHVSILDGTWLSGFDSLVSITWLLVLVSILFIKAMTCTWSGVVGSKVPRLFTAILSDRLGFFSLCHHSTICHGPDNV